MTVLVDTNVFEHKWNKRAIPDTILCQNVNSVSIQECLLNLLTNICYKGTYIILYLTNSNLKKKKPLLCPAFKYPY